MTNTTAPPEDAGMPLVSSATVYDLSYADGSGYRQLLLIGYDKQHATQSALAHLRGLNGARGYARRGRSGWINRNDPHAPKEKGPRTVRSLMLVHGVEGPSEGVSAAAPPPRHAMLRELRADSVSTERKFEARFATAPGQNAFFPEETEGNPSGIVLVRLDQEQARKARHLAPQPTIHVLDTNGA